jgi:FKBP-type peptidyl-prolyl cis-trans isomerase SlyD
MPISNNSIVSIHYRLTNDQNEEIDSSARTDPLIYLHGTGELIDGLERSLAGKQAGASFSVSIPPAEGYGAEAPDLIRVMHTDEFNVDSVRPATDEEIEAGQAL